MKGQGTNAITGLLDLIALQLLKHLTETLTVILMVDKAII